MTHVEIPPGTNRCNNHWYENNQYDTATCAACGANLVVYQVPQHKDPEKKSTWVSPHSTDDCIRHLQGETKDCRAHLIELLEREAYAIARWRELEATLARMGIGAMAEVKHVYPDGWNATPTLVEWAENQTRRR